MRDGPIRPSPSKRTKAVKACGKVSLFGVAAEKLPLSPEKLLTPHKQGHRVGIGLIVKGPSGRGIGIEMTKIYN